MNDGRPPKGDDRQAATAFEQAATVGRTTEELAREVEQTNPEQLGLPTTWEQAGQPIQIRGKEARIVSPSDSDVANYALSPRRTTCGSCKYFDLETGRKEMVRQRFGERLVRDDEWKLQHLGAPVDAIALCGAGGGELATTYVAMACDHYREKKKGRRGL